MPTPDDILTLVAQHYGITVEQLRGRTRTLGLAWARHVAMWLLRSARGDLSFPQLGRLFGRDHSTVIYAVEQVRASLPDPTTAAELAPLAAAVGLQQP